ncbi:MAG TPA: cysteine desulfurase [Cyclobacteriaceae bacterium]|nr:cysteine desulfurase [Cyclobacteriaceae bacterium]
MTSITHQEKLKLKITPETLRVQFPILNERVNGKQLIYYDNAATTQKPISVIDAISEYYKSYNANIHRGIHTLAEKATRAFEETRSTCRKFINAGEKEEIIFTSGATDGINLVSQAYGRKFLRKGDEILITAMEHHSNIVPWQMVCEQTGARLIITPVNDQGDIEIDNYNKLLSIRTKIVSITHISNALGTINPVKEMIAAAHSYGAVVLVDGAQAAAHTPIDVRALDSDFYVFSSHKVFGPTGIGILYGKRGLLESMDPYKGGGEMIREVRFEKTTYNDIPFKFEAGTPNIADVIGFGRALRFFENLPREELKAYESRLLHTATNKFKEIKGVRIIGQAREKAGIISIVADRVHHFDLGAMLDARGIAVRTGHHCAQPLMEKFGIEGTTRLSFSIYNTESELENFLEAFTDLLTILRKNGSR